MISIDQVEIDIKSLTIQGATNVALAIIEVLEQIPENKRQEVGKRLANTRPTEPLAQNILKYPGALDDYKKFITDAKEQIIHFGKNLIEDNKIYLTHCHASSVTSIFLRKKNKNFSVIATETRPLFQGRRTAKELVEGGIPTTMIVDSAVATVFEQQHIAAVFIGADLLTQYGFANKIGSLGIAQLAALKHIPVYCCTTLLKFRTNMIIENRNPKEIWENPPENLQFFSPAFDLIPYHENIHIICEAGIISGTMVKDAVTKKYPFIING
jgi:ribose 1,5-bisphosphate isomerase